MPLLVCLATAMGRPMRTKRAIVTTLVWLCVVLDHVPGLCRTEQSWLTARPRRYSDLGCALGLALWSARLDERWNTGVWGKR
jgi:hypothetical protein